MRKCLNGLILFSSLLLFMPVLCWSYQFDFSMSDLPENLSDKWLNTCIQTKLEKTGVKGSDEHPGRSGETLPLQYRRVSYLF